jgi:hypothetical protein
MERFDTVTTRLRRVFAELGYAQRRSFELRTGVPLGGPRPGRASGDEIAALEAAYGREPTLR